MSEWVWSKSMARGSSIMGDVFRDVTSDTATLKIVRIDAGDVPVDGSSPESSYVCQHSLAKRR